MLREEKKKSVTSIFIKMMSSRKRKIGIYDKLEKGKKLVGNLSRYEFTRKYYILRFFFPFTKHEFYSTSITWYTNLRFVSVNFPP